MKKTEDIICRAALKPEYLPRMVSGGEVEADIRTLLADCGRLRTLAGKAMQATTQLHVATGQETTAEERLIARLQYFQKRARRKYARSATPEALANYFIGSRLDGNQPNLLQ